MLKFFSASRDAVPCYPLMAAFFMGHDFDDLEIACSPMKHEAAAQTAKAPAAPLQGGDHPRMLMVDGSSFH